MLRKVPFDYFEEGQTLYFDLARLEELETMMGMPITEIFDQIAKGGVGAVLNGLMVGLKHHYPGKGKPFFRQKIESFWENGGRQGELVSPLMKAIIVSGIMGKEIAEEAESAETGEDAAEALLANASEKAENAEVPPKKPARASKAG